MKHPHREVIVLIGKPGSGKGTQAESLANALGIPAVSVGVLIRNEIKQGTKIGKKIKAVVAAGRLIPVRVWSILISKRLRRPDVKKGIILDGSPRDLAQAVILDKIGPVTHALLISITDKEVIRRLSGRRVCSVCGTNYHVKVHRPKREGICDKCGGKIIRRDDDKIKVIRERLKSYREETFPVLNYYRRKRTLLRINGQLGIGQVAKKMIEAVKKADQ